MNNEFVHLHNHTEYSLLDGLSRVSKIVHQASNLGMKAIAITDHGGLYGAIEFYLECKQAGIKPIIGLEAYLAQGSRNSKTNSDKSPYHLLLLAKNIQGYQNLLKLTTKSHLEGFYYKPRIDKELLETHKEGLIVLSGCPSAEIPRLISEDRFEEAKEVAIWYKETFEHFYLEIQRHEDMPELEPINKNLLRISSEASIPIVATNDSHYINQNDAPIQDLLICIHTNTNIYDDKRLRMSGDSFYLKTDEEMSDVFADLPEAILNTKYIADLCELELDFTQLRLPKYHATENLSADDYLVNLCWEGFENRFPNPTNVMIQRLEYELDVIRKTQFSNYFLVVHDIAKFAHEAGILFGVRGSAAASLALYCLGVTDIDPLQYRLVFERFLNLERREMPDIDMDFQDDRRDEVIEYVRQSYGSDHVAQIITFGTLGAKAAIRDTGRALGLPYSTVDEVAKLIPTKVNNLEEAIEMTPALRDMYDQDPSLRNLMDKAKRLEGVARHASTHAAGVVISGEPLVEYVPLQRPVRGGSENIAMTQFPMDPIAKLGLLKMDFLGLTNMSILEIARHLINERHGLNIDLNQLRLDDTKAFELISSGETTGIFQLESAGMRRYVQKLRPSSINDIAAMIALYRPGPMEHIDTFIDAKHGRTPIRYPHSTLQEILEETYGVIVYQDQVLLIAQAFAGYSLGEADVVRKAMGKKIPEVMGHEKEKFINGALGNGFTKGLAEEVFQLIEPFAGYAFNKAHSVSYALIAYWTAYLKSNFPEEYMAALMNAHSGQAEKIVLDVTECTRLDIPVLLPDINRSQSEFSIDVNPDGKSSIRFGLSTVKNVGANAVKPLIESRKTQGIFTSIEDMCRRADIKGLNRRALESLVKVGALDALAPRGNILASMEQILTTAQREAKLRESGQTTMFDMFGESVEAPMAKITLQEGDVQRQEQLGWERELLGTFVSKNPLSDLIHNSSTNAIISQSDLTPEHIGQRLTMVGQILSKTLRNTKDGKEFAVIEMGLLSGSVSVMVWPNILQKTREIWFDGNIIKVVGKLRERQGQVSLHCDEVDSHTTDQSTTSHTDGNQLDGSKTNNRENGQDQQTAPVHINSNGSNNTSTLKLWISLEESENPEQDEYLLREVVRLLLNYPGETTVGLRIKTGGKTVTGDLPEYPILYSNTLHQELESKLGPNTITMESLQY